MGFLSFTYSLTLNLKKYDLCYLQVLTLIITFMCKFNSLHVSMFHF